MPYKLKKSGSGYKVCKKLGKKKCFSKKALPKSRALDQMRAIMANENLSFSDYYYLQEVLNYDVEKKELSIDTTDPNYPNGYGIKDTFTIIKKLWRDRSELIKFLKANINILSPIVIVISIIVMGFNADEFFKQHPELNIPPQTVDKAARFLDKHPEVLKFFK